MKLIKFSKIFFPLFSLCGIFLVSCQQEILEQRPSMHTMPEIRGFSYPSYTKNGFRKGLGNRALEDLRAQTAADFVALSFFEYQNYDTSTKIAPNINAWNPVIKDGWSSSATLEDIEAAILHARRNGMKIMLKPHVDTYSGQWRALIRPDADGKWFSSYTEMLLKYARLAQKYNVEMVCIGVEYLYATTPEYTSRWRYLIKEIRKIYSGKLTYGANWSGQPQLGLPSNEFEQIQFWDDLDYIGIDAYYPLSSQRMGDALPSALKKMQPHVDKITKISNKFGKKVIFVEAGIQSARGALSQPYEFNVGNKPNAVTDELSQEFYYRTMIESFGRQPWCAGIFWWNWDCVPTSFEKRDYTVRNKCSAKLVKDWYTGNLPQILRLEQ